MLHCLTLMRSCMFISQRLAIELSRSQGGGKKGAPGKLPVSVILCMTDNLSIGERLQNYNTIRFPSNCLH